MPKSRVPYQSSRFPKNKPGRTFCSEFIWRLFFGNIFRNSKVLREMYPRATFTRSKRSSVTNQPAGLSSCPTPMVFPKKESGSGCLRVSSNNTWVPVPSIAAVPAISGYCSHTRTLPGQLGQRWFDGDSLACLLVCKVFFPLVQNVLVVVLVDVLKCFHCFFSICPSSKELP